MKPSFILTLPTIGFILNLPTTMSNWLNGLPQELYDAILKYLTPEDVLKVVCETKRRSKSMPQVYASDSKCFAFQNMVNRWYTPYRVKVKTQARTVKLNTTKLKRLSKSIRVTNICGCKNIMWFKKIKCSNFCVNFDKKAKIRNVYNSKLVNPHTLTKVLYMYYLNFLKANFKLYKNKIGCVQQTGTAYRANFITHIYLRQF
ncbi:hypothetical protein [Clostera anachoreta granulovirus]|uniref:F-box domain-containing protein n=1 Tax=Clostera anachoreta granulovirus TaxID=283675 RepID=F4ZKR8_9BBAC|nr:hypothetical protein ClanGV_gp041 [Clostera anachoreta granulovirus]AEB00329.1 hypothetical protein [Clostera anachoreta granulovirus]